MGTSDWRARDQDRDAAIEVVEAAWADGQIVEVDRDHRVAALLRAETVQEVRMLVHDLQPAAAPAPAPAAPEVPAVPHPYASPATATATATAAGSGTKSAGLVGVVVIFAIVAAVGSGVLAAIGGMTSSMGSDSVISSEVPLPGEVAEDGVNVLSKGGYRDLVRAVRRSTGATDAFEGVLYPGYAVLTLPVDWSSQREDRWYWDGELESLDSQGTSSYERFDLSSVDAGVMVRLVKRVRRLVDEPTSWYAIVRAPDPDDRTTMWVYASNEFNESAYLSARRDGTVVHDSTKP